MRTFFYAFGILSFVVLIGTSLYFFGSWLYENFYQLFIGFFFWFGVVSAILICLFSVIRLIYGPKWPVSLGTSLFLGPELRQVSRQMVSEFKQGKVDELTLTDFAAAIFKRLTRVGLIGLVIAAFPILLLMQQNQLLRIQNDLFSLQDTLIMNQNEKIDSQLLMRIKG